jgi:hypothetical protein
VDNGIPLDAFLTCRLRGYEARYRHSHYPLPFDVAPDQGHLAVIPNPDYLPAWQELREDPEGEETGKRLQALSEREELTRELEELDEEDAWLRARLFTIRDMQEALADEKGEAIATGRMSGPTTASRRARARRPPHMSFPWLPVLGYTAITVLTLVESYQVAQPMLDAIGVDTTRIASEWTTNPSGVLGGAGFALATSVGLFFLWYLLLRSAHALVRSLDSAAPSRIARQAVGLLFLVVSLLAGSFIMANLRHGMARDASELLGAKAGMGTSAFLFLTLLVPCAAAYLHHRIAQSAYWQRRSDILAAKYQWEQDEEERRVPEEALADRLRLILDRRVSIEHQRAQLRQRRSSLAKRAQAAHRKQLARLDKARSTAEAYARTLLSALEQDRYYFLRQAHRSQAWHLVPWDARGQSKAEPRCRVARALLTAARNGHMS